ncbi:MAG: Holliday junction branch migration protein RuvA [Clostridium sp.]|nr:MAG: Holliday junction branch migration protein RuvA [Clostridium sp.]
MRLHLSTLCVKNNKIGYLLIVSNPYNYKPNETYKIYTYLYVREDIFFDLYGFKTKAERDLFLKLISVSGIGPKSALSILASGSVNEIVEAIEDRNDAYLRKFPGIGAKASQQIILDLRGKVSFDSVDNPSVHSSKLDDVEDALIALGYNKKEITKVIAKLDGTKDEGDLVKEALKLITKM